MVETTIVLGTTAQHLGMPLADLVAWALLLAFLAAPAPYDSAKVHILEIGGAKLQPAVARRRLDKAAIVAAPVVAVVVPATARLSPVDQWQTVSRMVADGAERVMAVARDHQAIRRELDSLDLTLENMRRELAAVMTSALPTMHQAELVPIPARRPSYAIAA